jgi:hypothetical protein
VGKKKEKEKKEERKISKDKHTRHTLTPAPTLACLTHTLTPCMSLGQGTLLLAAVVCPRPLWRACAMPRILPRKAAAVS